MLYGSNTGWCPPAAPVNGSIRRTTLPRSSVAYMRAHVPGRHHVLHLDADRELVDHLEGLGGRSPTRHRTWSAARRRTPWTAGRPARACWRRPRSRCWSGRPPAASRAARRRPPAAGAALGALGLGALGLAAAVLLSVIVGDATVVSAIDMVPWSIDSCGSAGRVSAATLSAAALPELALLDGDAVVPAVDPLEHPATSATAPSISARGPRGRLMIPPGSGRPTVSVRHYPSAGITHRLESPITDDDRQHHPSTGPRYARATRFGTTICQASSTISRACSASIRSSRTTIQL